MPVEEEDGKVGGLQQQMNDTVPYASQERQELIEVRLLYYVNSIVSLKVRICEL